MKFYNKNKKQYLPNGEIDKFLSQLHLLCKKYKMTITTTDIKYPLVVREYSKHNVQHMLGNIHNEIEHKKAEQQKDKKSNEGKNSKG